jgi:hypothetical protein
MLFGPTRRSGSSYAISRRHCATGKRCAGSARGSEPALLLGQVCESSVREGLGERDVGVELNLSVAFRQLTEAENLRTSLPGSPRNRAVGAIRPGKARRPTWRPSQRNSLQPLQLPAHEEISRGGDSIR